MTVGCVGTDIAVNGVASSDDSVDGRRAIEPRRCCDAKSVGQPGVDFGIHESSHRRGQTRKFFTGRDRVSTFHGLTATILAFDLQQRQTRINVRSNSHFEASRAAVGGVEIKIAFFSVVIGRCVAEMAAGVDFEHHDVLVKVQSVKQIESNHVLSVNSRL